ncbi:unnamed protein product [Symbiodinium sp. CCMP2456]|nr:unnamed protein product [Symbiodinium sp. CCMP2456]
MGPAPKSDEEDQQLQAGLVAPIPPTLARPEWSQSVDSVSANGRSSSSGRFHGEFQDMAHCLSRASGSEQLLALQSLCEALQEGGHDAAERACAAGTVEVSLGLLRAGAGEGPLLVRTVEALWYMADDYESCLRIVDLNGHQLLCQLAREHGQDNPDAAGGIFRLLAETLYTEPRSSRLWGEALDANLLAAAVNWAVQQAGCSDPECSTTLGFVCDVAALWLQRVPDKEAAKPLVGIVPQLLKIMAFRLDDVLLLQHGFRLLWAFAHKSTEWPEALRQPTICALQQLRVLVEARPFAAPNAIHYNAMALQARGEKLRIRSFERSARWQAICGLAPCTTVQTSLGLDSMD